MSINIFIVTLYKYLFLKKLSIILNSTLFFQTHKGIKCPFRLENIIPAHAFEEYEGLDEFTWINQMFEKSEADSISSGLQKTIFHMKKIEIIIVRLNQ